MTSSRSDELSGYELNRAIAEALGLEWKSYTADWAHDAGAALRLLCYRWVVERGRGIMVLPKDDGECQAVFMLSDYGEFEYWNPYVPTGWHKGRTPAEALARLALAALRKEKEAD